MRRTSWILLPLCLAAVLAAGFAGAEERSHSPTWMSSQGSFGVMMLLTTDADAFLKTWNPRKPIDEPPEAPANQLAEKVERGKALSAFLLFRGCTPDALELCRAETSFVVLRPDGTLYARLPEAELWKDKAPPPADTLRLGVASLEVEIEPKDPLGTYTVQARVCDQVSGACLDVSDTFEATEAVLSW